MNLSQVKPYFNSITNNLIERKNILEKENDSLYDKIKTNDKYIECLENELIIWKKLAKENLKINREITNYVKNKYNDDNPSNILENKFSVVCEEIIDLKKN